MLGIYSLLSRRYLLWWPFGGGWNVEGILRLTTYLLIYSVGLFMSSILLERKEGTFIFLSPSKGPRFPHSVFWHQS